MSVHCEPCSQSTLSLLTPFCPSIVIPVMVTREFRMSTTSAVPPEASLIDAPARPVTVNRSISLITTFSRHPPVTLMVFGPVASVCCSVLSAAPMLVSPTFPSQLTYSVAALAAPTDISWARSRQAIRALFKRDMRFPPRQVVGLCPGRASFVPRSATGGSPLCLLRVRHDEEGLPRYDGYDSAGAVRVGLRGAATRVFRQLRTGLSESWRVPLRQAFNRYQGFLGDSED